MTPQVGDRIWNTIQEATGKVVAIQRFDDGEILLGIKWDDGVERLDMKPYDCHWLPEYVINDLDEIPL